MTAPNHGVGFACPSSTLEAQWPTRRPRRRRRALRSRSLSAASFSPTSRRSLSRTSPQRTSLSRVRVARGPQDYGAEHRPPVVAVVVPERELVEVPLQPAVGDLLVVPTDAGL